MSRDLGRKEGMRKVTHEIAKNMLKDKIGIETIKKWTGLTEREIKEIRK